MAIETEPGTIQHPGGGQPGAAGQERGPGFGDGVVAPAGELRERDGPQGRRAESFRGRPRRRERGTRRGDGGEQRQGKAAGEEGDESVADDLTTINENTAITTQRKTNERNNL